MSLRTKEMYLDMSAVTMNLRRLNIVIMPAKIQKGLLAAGNKFMVDTVIGRPTMPIKRPGYGGVWSGEGWTASERRAGELRASGALFVDGVKKRDTMYYGEFATGKYQPVAYGGSPILPMTHEACVVFNAPYAALQHEKWKEKTEPGAGMYFMSEKLYGNAIEYMTIIAETVRL